MHVLVFDDDNAVGQVVARAAMAAGFDAAAVSDAETFATGLRRDPPQVIVLDLQLGPTDGVEQLRLLAEWKYPGLLVLMSGFDARVISGAYGLAQSLGLKVHGVLEKPLRLADLEQLMQTLQKAGKELTRERLREAISDDELSLDFQPVVTRNPKKLQKLGALVRWDHPVVGRIPPSAFLPRAEQDLATIDALTDWVLGAAVDSYQVLAELGVNVPLSVTISSLNLQDLTLPDRLEEKLRSGNMPASHLHIEVTESAAIADAERCIDVMTRLRLKGIVLSMNNFGAGYSSFKILRQMPFSEIKVDRSFILDIATSRDARLIVRSIIDLAVSLKISCAAAGVESEQTAAMLEEMGISNLLGDFIACPMAVESIPIWLAGWTGAASASSKGGALSTLRQVVELPSHVETRSAVSPPIVDAVHLPPRQLQVVELLSEGRSVKEIARELGLGVGTVKVHLSLAYTALGARNRIEAIRRAEPILCVKREQNSIAVCGRA